MTDALTTQDQTPAAKACGPRHVRSDIPFFTGMIATGSRP